VSSPDCSVCESTSAPFAEPIQSVLLVLNMVCGADRRVEIWIIQTLISAVAQLPTALADRSFCD